MPSELIVNRLGPADWRWAIVLTVGWSNIVSGAAIYILARSESLFVFDWIEWLGISGTVRTLRADAAPIFQSLPDFLLFSFPDGAWVLGFMTQMSWVWRSSPGGEAKWWISLGPVLGLGGELSQLAGLLPGTFDVADVFALSAASALGAWLAYWPHSSQQY